MRGVTTCFWLAAALVACWNEQTRTSGSGLTGDPARPDCGFTVAEPPLPVTPDPCAAGELVFGPERFERATGTPEGAVRDFTVPAVGAVCVRVWNAGVSAAEVQLDGATLISPSRFNPHVTEITERADVAAGDHVLSVSVRSRPGSALDLEVRFAPGETVTYGRREGRFLAVQNLRDDPDPFSPGDLNGVRDATTLSVEVDVRRLPGGPTMAYGLRTTFEIADPVACSDTRRLLVEIPLELGTVPRRELPSSAWDGRDAAASVVPDGGYFYRAVTELVRVRRSGRAEVVDSLASDIQRVTVDNTPPAVVLSRPAMLPYDAAGTPVVPLGPTDAATEEVAGIITDTGGLADAWLRSPFLSASLADGEFSVDVPLVLDEAGMEEWWTPVAVLARDRAGNEALVTWRFVALPPFLPGMVVVAFHPESSRDDVQRVFSETGARLLLPRPDVRSYIVAAPVGVPPVSFAAELRRRSEVGYALPGVPVQPMGCPPLPEPPDDPFFGSHHAWHLDNGPDLSYPVAATCSDMAPCPGPGEACSAGECGCSADADCAAGLGCRDGRCSLIGREGADLGWWDGIESVCALDRPEAAPVIALLDKLPYVDDPDLSENLFVSEFECCGAAGCSPPCHGGEVIPDRDCVVDGDCSAGETCVVVPSMSICASGLLRGASCSIDEDCFWVGGDERTYPATCETLPGLGRCTDGCAGACGVDDDGDGAADDLDVEVAGLKQRLCSNARINFATCLPDGSCPDVVLIDDDGDGTPNDCGPEAVGLPEDALAAWDDDENGVIDDVNGANFRQAARGGELFAVVMPGRTVDEWRRLLCIGAGEERECAPVGSHGSAMMDLMAGSVNNAFAGSGVLPRARILAVDDTASPDALFNSVRYALTRHPVVTNFSAVLTYYEDPPGDEPPMAPEDYDSMVASVRRAWDYATGPDLLIFAAATNSRADLDVIAMLLSPRREFLAPQYFHDLGGGVRDERVAVVTSSNMSDQFADFFEACWSGDPARPRCWAGPGRGAQGVAFASPGDGYLARDAFEGAAGDVAFGSADATSGATAIASAVAAAGAAAFPDVLGRHPGLVLQRVVDTLVALDPPPWLASLDGLMRHPGRVDLQRVIDAAIRLPDLRPFEEESYRLGDTQLRNTKDLDFVDADLDGHFDYLLEIFGGPYPDFDQPRLYRWDAASGAFRDETWGTDGAPGGTDEAADRLPDLAGNYNKAANADLDGDGCTDIVLGGFLQQDPGGAGLRGLRNRLLLQVRDPGGAPSCTGRFEDHTDDPLPDGPRLPTRDDITRDVDLLDFDGDSDLDILFTNAQVDLPGGEFNDQLLRSMLAEDGVLRFADASDRLPAPPRPGDPHAGATASCDVDNDGDRDIVQAMNGERNRLLINDAGTFEDRTLAWDFPLGTGFSHAVRCHDWCEPDGGGVPDGFPEIVFGRRSDLKEIYLVNTEGSFIDRSDLLPDVFDTTQEVELCNLDEDDEPELLIGNGDILLGLRSPNRVLDRGVDGVFREDGVAEALGFAFATIFDLTEDIECADLDGLGADDIVVVGNTGQRNFLYRRTR
jgi:hypothetical protein